MCDDWMSIKDGIWQSVFWVLKKEYFYSQKENISGVGQNLPAWRLKPEFSNYIYFLLLHKTYIKDNAKTSNHLPSQEI